jgi:hypothetical protein
MLDKVTIRSLRRTGGASGASRESAFVIVETADFGAPISLIQEFAEAPTAPRELEEFAEALHSRCGRTGAGEQTQAHPLKPPRSPGAEVSLKASQHDSSS